MLQLLKNLRRSVATLDICGEWGTGDSADDEAALEVKTDRVWMEGRAQQRRLSALQVSLKVLLVNYSMSLVYVVAEQSFRLCCGQLQGCCDQCKVFRMNSMVCSLQTALLHV